MAYSKKNPADKKDYDNKYSPVTEPRMILFDPKVIFGEFVKDFNKYKPKRKK